MNHYTYYSYEEFGRGYIGKRSCKCSPEEDVRYFGSYTDKTFKPTQKIILETYDTATEAIADEIKLQHFFKVVLNTHFANQVYQTSTKFQGTSETARKALITYTPEKRREAIRKALITYTTEKRKEVVKKMHSSKTPEQRSEVAKKRERNMTIEQKERRVKNRIATMTPQQRSEAARKSYLNANKTPEQRSEFAKKAAKKRIENTTPEQRSEISRKGQASRTPEQRSEAARKRNTVKFQCTVTGFISNAGSLSSYQKARGIDTSNRVRLS
jgi:hypothetical protein